MSAHENLEHAEHAEHASHGGNKKIALLISLLALFLAFSETLGKNAQTSAIDSNVQSSNLWAFFQAKTIRMTVLRTAATRLDLDAAGITDEAAKTRVAKIVDDWRATAARYEDEPSTHEGRKQLAERAQAAEKKTDLSMARYHNFEMASACYQIGIVLASAEIITAITALGWLSGILGIGGIAFTAIGLWAPHAVHLF
jgi:hypothetical protein